LAGLGDADVIRSARGRATGDAIRSLVISDKLLGTKEWFVIHHANCGVELFTNEVMSGLETAALNHSGFKGWGPGHRRASTSYG
jgi:carbonic anhydrase